MPSVPPSPAPASLEDWAAALIQGRQTILPKRLDAPGPDARQLGLILDAAAAAPDHGRLLPWRFVLVPQAARGALADAFEQALLERDPRAGAEQRAQAREKAFRAPVLLLAVARLRDPQAPQADGDMEAEVPDDERILSAGCAVQNMLLMATALGFGSALTSGKAMGSTPLRALFGLGPHERALCFVSIGTPTRRKPAPPRPARKAFLSTLEPPRLTARPAPLSLLPHAPAAGWEQPFEMLEACHERVQRMLALLARLRAHVAAQGADEQARQAARDVMRYFDQAAPQHHRDEELHVFPPLLARGEPAVVAVVERLLADHRAMEAGWSRARAVLQALASGTTTALGADDEAALTAFAALYAGHIEAEEQVAYPAARAGLDEAALREAGREMAARRGVR